MNLETQRKLQEMLYLLEKLADEEATARNEGFRDGYHKAVNRTLKHRNNIMAFCRKHWKEEEAQMVYVPVFEQDGNKFFITHVDFAADTEDDAIQIGYGAMFVEGIVFNFKFNGEVREVDPDNTPHLRARLSNFNVSIIEGPMFDEVNDGH